jgi:hypothetical protein
MLGSSGFNNMAGPDLHGMAQHIWAPAGSIFPLTCNSFVAHEIDRLTQISIYSLVVRTDENIVSTSDVHLEPKF